MVFARRSMGSKRTDVVRLVPLAQVTEDREPLWWPLRHQFVFWSIVYVLGLGGVLFAMTALRIIVNAIGG